MTNRRLSLAMASLAISIALFLVVLIVPPLVSGQELPEPRSEVFFSWAYVIGALAAISWKITMGVSKTLPIERFRWKKLFVPSITAVVVSIPLVFLVMPRFGRPTGNFMNDLIYAYLTTYTTVDMTADLFTVTSLVRAHFANGDPLDPPKPPLPPVS